jgi:hypothetical protein
MIFHDFEIVMRFLCENLFYAFCSAVFACTSASVPIAPNTS